MDLPSGRAAAGRRTLVLDGTGRGRTRAVVRRAEGKVGRRESGAVILAAAELLADLAAMGACEISGRPDLDPAPSGPIPLARSLLPSRTSDEAKAVAMRAVVEGETRLAEGEGGAAALSFTRALEVAPKQYKIVQRARQGRNEALRSVGEASRAGEDFRKQWLWGRGVRWPGHYIIDYILLRNLIAKAFPADGAEQAPPARPGALRPEWFLVLALIAVYNTLLLKYGLEY